MPNRISSHILISGTGRAGTTFLVRLLTRLGLDTGFAPDDPRIESGSASGLEWDLAADNPPRVVKSPWLCSQLDAILHRGDRRVEHVVIPVRNLHDAAESRRQVTLRVAPEAPPNSIPGGVWLCERPEEQETVLAREFYQLCLTLARYDIPHTFIDFPRFVVDPLYLYRKLQPVFRLGGYPNFATEFSALSEPSLVHRFRQEIEERGEPELTVTASPENTGSMPVSPPVNPLWRFFARNEGPRIHKWHHYFDIYHQHFARYRNTNVRLLEFGVSHGGSLRMWRDYFGPRAQIIGVDINPACASLATDDINVIIGDQSDRVFLQKLKELLPVIDILIDDGGHTMEQQLATFDNMYDSVSADGIYLCEDLHTSYWEEYGGGYLQQGTFVEFAKRMVDRLNAWHSRDPLLKPDEITRSASGIHFYDSVVVIEKSPRPAPPDVSMTGHSTL